MAEEVIDLTPEQQLQAEQLSAGIDLSPEQETQARQLSGQLDPLLDFTPDQLSALEISDPENFNIRREYLNRPELHKGDVLMRAALANQKVRARYEAPELSTVGMPPTVALGARVVGAGKQLFETAKTVTPSVAAKAVWHFASGVAKYAANSIAGAASPFVPEETTQNYRRLAAENLAASNLAIANLASGVKTTAHKAAQIAGVAKPFSEYDPTEARELFLADLDKEFEREEITRGKGAVTRQIGGEVIKELEAVGKPIRPEEVTALSAGDPFTFYAYTKLFGAAGGLVPAEAKAAASSASRWVGEVGRDITGTALEGIGESARILSKGTTALSKIPAQIIPPSVLPPIVLPLIKRAARIIPDISEGVKSVGKQIRTGEFVSPSARLIADIAETAPAAIGDIAGGIAFDIGTTAAMAEFPEEEVGGGVGIGTAFGLIGAGRHVTRRVISGQEIAPRVWGGKNQIPTSGPFKGSEFDTLHGTAYQTATPAIKQRVNAVREFLRKGAPGVDLFYVPDKAAFETSLVNAGVPAADARLWADQSGVFVKDLNGKRVAFAIDIDAAPHESFHPFQDVIGETANNILNQKVKSAYTDAEFEREGMRYASRLGWDGRGDWRDFTLDASGEGYHATIDKLAQEAANIIKLSEGKEPTPAEAKEQGTRMFAEAMAEATAANPDIDPNIIRRSVWRGILTEAEQKALADNYAANELAAETWDAVFKHTGPGMKDPKGLIPKFARVAGNLVAMMGGEPLAGRESQIGELPLKRAAVDAVREAVRGRIETPPLISGEAAIPRTPAKPSPSAPTRPGAPIGTPEQEAEITKTVAAAAPEQPTGPEVDAQSPREILGTFAESKATGQGVKITRRTAPGTPAGAIEVSRGKRREQIETARGIPDDQKPLWEKNFTPVKTVVLNDGSIQEQGWSPEVLAANAEKTAKFLSDTNPSLSPFEIDTTQKTFTASGWKNLFDKVNIFAANQATGLTGKGTPLVIGRAREFGFFEPVGTREAAGTLTDAEANFINYLFGFPLPGKGPVLKRGGKAQFGEQLITEATEPGRAQPLVEPRTFGSKQAEQLGFAGEQLLEVNPLRTQIEQAGANPPSLIEAWQNLNLRDIVRADLAPELPAVRPVGVTLRAGFQPMPANKMAIRSPAMKDEKTGRIYEGVIHASAQETAEQSGASGPFIRGFTTNRELSKGEREFLDADEAFARAEQIGQLPEGQLEMPGGGLESTRFEEVRKFSPKQLVTPENEKQFSKSSVRFEDGTLKPVFHATVADFHPAEINTEAFQAHFGSPSAAAARVLGPIHGRNIAAKDESGAKTMPVFLDIKNPVRLADAGNWESAQSVSNELYKRFGARLPVQFRETYVQNKVDKNTSTYFDKEGMTEEAAYLRANSEIVSEMKRWIQERGYDGIVYENEHEAPPIIQGETFVSELGYEYGQDSYIAFSNDQVHSALKFSPKRKEIELIGPDGLKYKATFDGYMDMSLIGLGQVPQITPLENLPGSKVKGSTTYGPSLEKAGYKLPADLPPPEITEGEAKFSPRKRKEADPLKFIKSTYGSLSKAWILPSGAVEQLGAQWHHHWLSEHPEIAAKYKLDVPEFEGSDTEGVRESALKKGFARVNFDGNTLTIEAREKNWRNLRPIVEDMIEKNLDDIDKFRINLLDDEVATLKKTYSENLFDADNDRAKMDRVYEAFSEGARNERGAAFSPKTDAGRKLEEEGFRFRLVPNETGTIFRVSVGKGGEEIGYISATLDGEKAEIHMVHVDAKYRQQGIGEALYRELASELQQRGASSVGGYTAGPSLGIRERVFGGVESPEAGTTKVSSPIRPEAKFSPKREQFEDPETIREALSSPGWAVITGTQEALGKWNAPANVEANKKLEADLQEKGYEYVPVKGTYKGVPQGADFLVLDISTYDAQALGKKYKQESVLTPKGLLYGDGTITEGDTANALLGAEARKQEFFSTLPNGLSFSVPLDFSKAPYQPVGEQSTLFGGREYESPANFTQAELKQHYPEAIVPSNSNQKIGSDIVNSPLYKKSDNPTNAFADKIIEFVKQYEDNPVYQLGLRWYSDIVPMLKKEFGADAPMMTELLAASSPNEKPDMNFFYAVDALEGFKSGRFDKIVSKFNEGFELYKSDKWLSWYTRELKAGNIVNPPQNPTPEAFLANWIYKHDLKPKQSNGQLYGFHGKAILEVMAGKWLQQNKGPKVGNFVQNLQGTGHEATIDVWADRTMRRIGYADARNRWRIMPANGEGVSDADFAFSQKAFRAAADKLGIEADSLQGGLWFAEKSLWSENGWGRLDLGSYAVEMGKLPLIRQAIKQRLTKTAQRAKVTPMKTGELKFSPKGEWTEGRDAREGDDGSFYEFFTPGDLLPIGSIQEDIPGTWTALFKAGQKPKVRTFDDEQAARDWIESQTEIDVQPRPSRAKVTPMKTGELKFSPKGEWTEGRDAREGDDGSFYEFFTPGDLLPIGSIQEDIPGTWTALFKAGQKPKVRTFDDEQAARDWIESQTEIAATPEPMKAKQSSPKRAGKKIYNVGPYGRTDESILAGSPEEAFRIYERSHKIVKGSIASKTLTYQGPYSPNK